MPPNPFEIPQQMRDVAEKNIEQARQIYAQYIAAVAQAINWSKPASSNKVVSDFKAVQDQAIAFAKQNAEAGFALASDLAKAKDLDEVFSLQSKFAQAQIKSYVLQAQELGQLTAKAFQSL